VKPSRISISFAATAQASLVCHGRTITGHSQAVAMICGSPAPSFELRLLLGILNPQHLAPDWVWMGVLLGMGEPDIPGACLFRIFRLFVYFGYAACHDAV
jgi:hypothetical protein